MRMAEEASKNITATPPRRANPLNFFNEVRRETSKVTWPSWRETYLTTIMVLIMTFITMMFFAIVDYMLGLGLNFVLGIA